MHHPCLLMLSALERGHRDQALVFQAPWEQQRSAAPCPGHAINLGTEWESKAKKEVALSHFSPCLKEERLLMYSFIYNPGFTIILRFWGFFCPRSEPATGSQ